MVKTYTDLRSDVNSLYPKAMINPMPMEMLPFLKMDRILDLYKNGLGDFFGFLKVTISCPDSVFRPVLPFKYKGKTIHPRDTFTATYFSEELKAVLPLGYKIIKIHSAVEFSKGDLFTDYINEMYEIKMNATGATRWIAKLLQNSLYGIFGRRLETL